jgi:hypothetical protein
MSLQAETRGRKPRIYQDTDDGIEIVLEYLQVLADGFEFAKNEKIE